MAELTALHEHQTITVPGTVEELLQFIHLMPVGVLKFGPSGAVDLVNPVAAQLLTPLLGAGARLDNIFDALRAHVPDLAARLAAAGDRLGTILDQHRIEASIGRQPLVLSLTVTRFSATSYMAVLKDVSRLTEMLTFAFTSSDLLIDLDPDGRIGWAAGAFPALLGFAAKEAVGRPLSGLFAPRDREMLAKSLAAIRRGGRMPPLTLRLANRAETRCVVAGMALGDGSDRLYVTIGRAPVPMLAPDHAVKPGRAFGIEAESWVRGGQAGVLGLIDVPDWKSTAGGMDGQMLGLLKREIGHLAGALGGEGVVMGEIADGRFGVLAPGTLDLDRLGDSMRALLGNFTPSAPARVEGQRIALEEGGLTPVQAVQAMRLLLSRFSGRGKDGLALGPDAGSLSAIFAEAQGHRKLIAAMIAARSFEMAYQPIVGLADRQVHHFEALLRPVQDPDDPAASPQEVATLAEALGLSTALDLAVLERAVAAIRRSGASIAVNVSALSLSEPAFVETLLREAVGLPHGLLMIELTETSEIEDMPRVAASIARIRAAGVAVCLDDFGAGSASFRYLRDLQVDIVKIDGAYVRAATRDEQGRAFVLSMRELASSVGAETIAEMVETEEDAALMAKLGVGYGQGWLFGRPGPLPAAAPRPAPAKPAPPKPGPPKPAPTLPLRRWRY